MRHALIRYQLGRFSSWRKATIRALARAVLINESIVTTKTRAKAARRLVERLIGLGKENSLSAKRLAYKELGDHMLVKRLFEEIAPRFKSTHGGYTRIFNLGNRRGDGAKKVIFEFLLKKEKPKREKKKEIPQVPKTEETVVKEGKTTPSQVVKETHKPTVKEKPKKFLGGIKKFFKQKRDTGS